LTIVVYVCCAEVVFSSAFAVIIQAVCANKVPYRVTSHIQNDGSLFAAIQLNQFIHRHISLAAGSGEYSSKVVN
jgi:hypothetical protein